jgi:hypothetical protein
VDLLRRRDGRRRIVNNWFRAAPMTRLWASRAALSGSEPVGMLCDRHDAASERQDANGPQQERDIGFFAFIVFVDHTGTDAMDVPIGRLPSIDE